MARRRRNRILALKDSNGEWIHDSDHLHQTTRNFFIDLYCENSRDVPFPLSGGFPAVSPIDWEFVHRPLTKEEIKETLFSMGPLRAPGPDGLHALFFQSQ